MSFEDFARSRSAALHGLAYAVTGSRDEAEDLVYEAMIEVWRSWDRHAESMRPAQMDQYVRDVVLNKLAKRRRRQRGYPADELKGKMGGPAIDHAGTEFVLRAINQMPGHMRPALRLLFLNDMTADEVAEKLGLGPDAMQDYLKMARKAGLDVETRFRPDGDSM
jgi:RNA polymerase sigma factor (sigma-70 family)